jgi:CRISPR/Cas system-associated exonuclease Cas4 (RecB family)
MGSSIVKNLGHKTFHGPLDVGKLTKIIEDAYATYNEPRDRKKRSFAPSGIGFGHGKCPRYWYIAFDGAVFIESNTPQGVANMKTGIAAHDRLGELLERSSLNVKGLEVEFQHNNPPIFGYIDAIIDRAGEEVIGEIKTTRTEAFRARQAKMSPPDYHLIQILIYMYVREAESGFFMYEDKNTHELLIMPVYMDEENKQYVEDVFEWLRTVNQSWRDRKLPEIPYRKNAKECKSCPVRDVCFDADQYGKGDVRLEPLKLKSV